MATSLPKTGRIRRAAVVDLTDPLLYLDRFALQPHDSLAVDLLGRAARVRAAALAEDVDAWGWAA